MTRTAYSPAQARSLHVIDVENEFGTASPTRTTVQTVAAAYLETSNWRAGDLTIIGSSRHCWVRAAFDWPTGVRWILRDGADGGELALIDALAHEPLWAIDRVIIASGDWLFAEPAARLAGLGVRVEVVCRAGALSRRLRMAVHEVRYLPVHEMGEAA